MAGTAASRKPVVAEVPDELSELFAPQEEGHEPEIAGKIPLGGSEYRVLAGSNAYLETGIASGDAAAFMRHLKAMIHDDDWEEFEEKLSSVPDLPTPRLMALWKLVWEIAAGRPTS